eukprot:1288339-Rhodomonas_salina.1
MSVALAGPVLAWRVTPEMWCAKSECGAVVPGSAASLGVWRSLRRRSASALEARPVGERRRRGQHRDPEPVPGLPVRDAAE